MQSYAARAIFPLWQIVAKALKSDGYEPVPALKNPGNTLVFEYREKAECLANSIEKQCSHTSTLHDPFHTSQIEEESTFNGLTSGVLSAHRRHLKVPTRVVTLRDSQCQGDPSGSSVGESHADGICMSICHVR
ncbi:hypothetical protein EVAR_15903_1 [Eumeta japonica]|uniref:Uncharacterized protein n=1 Tax=Eumeta variegata TaxID=151549 RepID=A0A4C1UF08_EUMVA|nr:hypothetical protein EVAR_15903_1 [Eumeta japonica]